MEREAIEPERKSKTPVRTLKYTPSANALNRYFRGYVRQKTKRPPAPSSCAAEQS
jgi:hypothetical protein